MTTALAAATALLIGVEATGWMFAVAGGRSVAREDCPTLEHPHQHPGSAARSSRSSTAAIAPPADGGAPTS